MPAPPWIAGQPFTASIGLSLTQPTLTDPGVEVATGGYVRHLVAFVPASGGGAMCNAMTFEWGRATARWGMIGWVTAWDLDGNYIGFGPVVDPVDEITPLPLLIDTGDVLRIKAGDLVGSVGAAPPRPYGVGGYGLGHYSKNYGSLSLLAALRDTFAPTGSPCCPGSANWQEAVL